MQFSGRVEAIFQRDHTPSEEKTRHVPVVFISKPRYEVTQHVYMLRQDLADMHVQAPTSSNQHLVERDALLLLGGLVVHDRLQKRLTLSNHTVVYYEHLIFFSHLNTDDKARIPDLSLATLYALMCALKHHRTGSTLMGERLEPMRPSPFKPQKKSALPQSVQQPQPEDHRLHSFFLKQFDSMGASCSITLDEHAKSRWVFELQP